MSARESGTDRNIAGLVALTGLALFAVMGIAGLVMRLAQANVLEVSPTWFYPLLTLHGVGMITGALLSGMGALWFVLRTDVALSVGRMIAAYVAILLGTAAVLVATVIGGFAAAWTFLWPLPFDAAGQWSTWATVVFLVGVLLVGVGFLIYCIDVLEQITRAFGGMSRTLGVDYLRGRDPSPPPPQILAGVVVAMAGIAASAAGTTILVALMVYSFDRGAHIDALWAKNLTYFYGHTVANLTIYLIIGALYVLLPRYTGRPWKTTAPIVVGWLLTLIFVLTVYSHHLYMDTVQPRVLEYISSASSDASAIPAAVVTIFSAMMLIWGSGYRWTLTSGLVYLGFAGWTIGGVGAVIDSLMPVNSRLHNTLWVPGHFHTYLLMGVMFWVFAFIAYLLEAAAGRPARTLSAWVALGLMVIGGYGLSAMWFAAGALGVPRRYAVQPPGTTGYSLAASIFTMIFAVGFLVMLAEFWTLAAAGLSQRRMTGVLDPWPMSRENWLAFRQRLALLDRERFGREPSVAPAGERAPDPAPGPALERARARRSVALAGLVVAIVTYPPIYGSAENDLTIHHLIHAGQFLAGGLFGLALGSLAPVSRRMRGGGGDALALVLAIAAPAAMLFAMAPRIYGPLEHHAVLHAAYHLGMGILGLLAGLGCARFGRVAGWFVLLAAVSMALLWAPGVIGA